MQGSLDGGVGLRRLAAFLLDHLVILVYLTALAALGLALIRLGLMDRVAVLLDAPWKGHALSLFLVTLPWVMYHASWEASPLGATPGKLVLGLRVRSAGGGPLSLERAVLRSMAKFAPWELTHTVIWRIPGWPGAMETLPPAPTVGLALVWVLVAAYLGSLILQGGRRTVYDHWAGTEISGAAMPDPAARQSPRSGDGPRRDRGPSGLAQDPLAPLATEPRRARGGLA
jgi:uncharacterized RDD family membrane protein YckC